MLSDHCCVHVNWAGIRGRKGLRHKAKLYRFENMWLQKQECENIVSNTWRSGPTPPALVRGISACSDALSVWSSKTFGNLPREIKKAKKELDRLQQGPQTQAIIEASRSLENRIAALLRKEEVFWLQHFRVSWMREGDRNTKFFHRVASGRKRRNWIEEIED